MTRSKVDGVKALRWTLLWILIGVRNANGGSGGGGNPSTPKNGTHARDSSRSPRGNHGGGWTPVMKEGEQRNIGKKETSKNSQGKDPSILKDLVEKWRVQEKREEEKWKKRKKKNKKEEGEAQKKEVVEEVQRAP